MCPDTKTSRRKATYRLRRQVYREGPGAAESRSAAELESRIAHLGKEKREWAERAAKLQDMLLRTRSDLENVRRRVQRERDEARIAITADLLSAFLLVLDHFELAVQAAKASSDPAAIVQGIEMIQRELKGVLESLGLEAITETNVAFDPTIHEAVAADSREGAEDRSVLEVMRPGWRFGDRCLRPAMVKVNRVAGGPSPTPAPS